jgi:hypothetical protein
MGFRVLRRARLPFRMFRMELQRLCEGKGAACRVPRPARVIELPFEMIKLLTDPLTFPPQSMARSRSTASARLRHSASCARPSASSAFGRSGTPPSSQNSPPNTRRYLMTVREQRLHRATSDLKRFGTHSAELWTLLTVTAVACTGRS